MIAPLLEALAGSALMIALVLVVRVPLRNAAGPRVAYALWALPVLRIILPPVPESWRGPIATPLSALGEQATVLIVPLDPAPVSAAAGVSLVALLAVAWASGAAMLFLWQVARYGLLRRRLLRTAVPLQRVRAVSVVESAAATGPLAFGVLRRFVAFPHDFADRWSTTERDLALAHELGHHARGDLLANWIALGVLALHWFNPVAWVAYRAFRADQEMANDAAVLAGRDRETVHAYGCAIVKAAHGGALSPACHLHNIKDLKGRLKMLGRERPSQMRMMLGGGATAAVALAALGASASGTATAQKVRTTVEKATGVELAALNVQTPTPPVVPSPPPAPVAAPTRTDVTTVTTADDKTSPKRVQRVIFVRDGKTTTLEGAEAEAFVAANPVPLPPLPPAPPVNGAGPLPPAPPAPPVPPGRITAQNCQFGDMPTTATVTAGETKGRKFTIVCARRIARDAAGAAADAARAGDLAERLAYTRALVGLESARAGVVGNQALSAEARTQALAGIDAALAELRDKSKQD